MISGGKAPLSQELSDSRRFVSLMEISSTMFEPADCIFSRGWKVETVSFIFLKHLTSFCTVYSFSHGCYFFVDYR